LHIPHAIQFIQSFKNLFDEQQIFVIEFRTL